VKNLLIKLRLMDHDGATLGGMVVASVLIVGGFLAVMMFGTLLFNRAACNNLEAVTGNDTEWRIAGGCFVELDGEFIPYDRWVNITGVGE
jgi:hypothetical protein